MFMEDLKDNAKRCEEEETFEGNKVEESDGDEESAGEGAKGEGCGCHLGEKDKEDVLRLRIKELEREKEELIREGNKKMVEFVDKKTKEASAILEEKKNELQRKYEREFSERIKYEYESQLSRLSNIISQFEAVIKSVQNPEVANYLVGFKMFLSQFDDLLKDFGIESIEPKIGDEFNSDVMEASKVVKITDEKNDNKVSNVYGKGYRLHDRIIKLASVEVGKIEG